MAELDGQDKGRRRAKAPGRAKAAAKKRLAGRANSVKANAEADAISALNHLVRREALRLLHDSDGPQSPVRTAEKLEHPLSSVSYHFRVLLQLQTIALVKKAPVRGAMEHFYISKVADNPMVVGILERTRKADGHLMHRR